MRQKEVMGQSIRTSKSARPGTITYVPIDKSEFRSTVSSDKKKNKIMKIVVMLIVMILVMSCCVYAGISYYYSYHFFLGTTINGIDSSNKTAYEVEHGNGSEVFLKRKIIWFKKRLFSVGKSWRNR